ncbi:MAG TPA: NAD(P)H-hydrate dehydratase [Acidobacteriaceae bacterium]|nr:NAD(P)H-hydrate dehydratase [Acidobacteriaceae bacterium]
MKILTAAEMRAADAATTAEYGIPSMSLMENSGAAVARFVLQEFPEAEGGGKRIVALCGKGNNGGDGLVAARILAEAGCDVGVLLLAHAADLKGDARTALERLSAAELVPVEAPDEAAFAAAEITELLDGADLFLDAVLGTGFRPPMRGVAVALGEWLAAHRESPVVSIDLPSGWDADSRAMQQPGAYRSDAVVTFTAPKLAHAFGFLTRGPVVVAEIGSPDAAVRSATGLDWAGSAKRLTETPRWPDSNKGKFGHVGIITGARGRAGAAAMASYAALRAGAGLVTAAVPESILNTVAAIAPELMTEPLAETTEGGIALRNLEGDRALLEKRTVVAIGPGLGQEAEAQQFALRLIELCGAPGLRISDKPIPMVLDADCLNAIAQHKYPLNGRGRTIVLTPHPGEMARLVGKSIAEVEADREGVARAYATEHHVTLVLKGWRTLIAHPDGGIAVNTTGNPGLAKGGSGDILTGIVAAMLAQYKENVAEALEAAVYLHGLAADFAVVERDEHTLLATEVCRYLDHAFRFRATQRDGITWLQGLPGMLKQEQHEATR